jgi:hypothetical protein
MVMVKQTKVRDDIETSTGNHIDIINEGELVEAFEQGLDAAGNTRVRLKYGWATAVSKGGVVVMQLVDDRMDTDRGQTGTASGTGLEMSLDEEAAWQEVLDDSGRTYFFNQATGESSWVKPASVSGAAPTPRGPRTPSEAQAFLQNMIESDHSSGHSTPRAD